MKPRPVQPPINPSPHPSTEPGLLQFVENLAASRALRDDEKGAVALERAARYSASLERSMIRTLHEIERVHARRMGQNVPLPLALDVTVGALAAEPH